jgi:hypothetical protein
MFIKNCKRACQNRKEFLDKSFIDRNSGHRTQHDLALNNPSKLT